jgi:hypothetical protein
MIDQYAYLHSTPSVKQLATLTHLLRNIKYNMAPLEHMVKHTAFSGLLPSLLLYFNTSQMDAHLHVPALYCVQAKVVLQATFWAGQFSTANYLQQHLLGGLWSFLLRMLPANVELQLQLLYYDRYKSQQERKPLLNMQACGRLHTELAAAAAAARASTDMRRLR